MSCEDSIEDTIEDTIVDSIEVPSVFEHTIKVPSVFECMRFSQDRRGLYDDVKRKFELCCSMATPPDFTLTNYDNITQLSAHKDVLSLKSGFFRRYFQRHPGSTEMTMPGDLNVCTTLICYMYETGLFTFPAYGSLFLVDLFVAARKYEVVDLDVAVAGCLRKDLQSYWNDWRPEKVMDVVEKVYSVTERFSRLREQLIIGLKSRPEFGDALRSELVRGRLMELPVFLIDVAGLGF